VRLGANNTYSTCASATLPTEVGQQSSNRQKNKEKVVKMKEIKKYFDQFFKDIKEQNKEIAIRAEKQ
jgi:hypothetical protein